MDAKPAEAQRPFLDSIIVPIADWWRKHAAAWENVDNLDSFGPDELARMALDVGIPASDLRALATHCSDAADLLERRIASLGLDSAALAHTATAQLRDMERLCTLCQSKGRCARDLAADPSDPVWHQYCPNEQTLSALAQERAG